MKKSIITLLLLSFVIRVAGQMSQLNSANGIYTPLAKSHLSTILNSNSAPKSALGSRTAGDSTLWLNYGIAVAIALQGGETYPAGSWLFPDSSVFIYGSHPNIHEIGNVFDAYSNTLATGYGFTQIPMSTPYTLDSLELTMAYERNDLSVTDTLVVYIFQAPRNSADIPVYFYPGQQQYFGADTVNVPILSYNSQKNGLTDVSAPITIIKLPLTEADTSFTYYKRMEFALPTPMQVKAGNLVATAFDFVPGYTYSTGENLDSLENLFYFRSLTEINSEGLPLPWYVPGDYYNSSSVIDNAVRYNLPNADGGYNGQFVPPIGFFQLGKEISLDDHAINYHITWTPTGIQNVSSVVSKQSIYPNPSSDEAMLTYTLKTGAVVIINLYDITGKLVRSKSEGNVSAGLNQQIINTQDLSNGVYLVSIEANGSTSVSKLVVAR